MTLRQALSVARDRLVAAGIASDEAAIDAELFARTILGWDRARLLTESNQVVPAGLEPKFSAWVDRRSTREPSAYITGVREFYGLELEVTPAVLIPRPETEMIVEAALPLIVRELDARVADIGTGCGNVAVTLAHEARKCTVVATDVSMDALMVAKRNAARHGVFNRIEFVHTPYLEGVPGEFDLIAANPPYVRETDRAALSPTVLREPHVALFGGVDGMRDIEGVLEATVGKLRLGGWLIMEFGFGQEDEVRDRVARHDDLRFDRVVADLQGLPRTAVITRDRRKSPRR
ncbi:MAG TPA: peptide chain release factor N(5)-glutamine methyltransferase [Vicinamibacterales bacterium]|nr:peptide chain release factor N(5)-glutamine methyltransferase [Vicinamibacterales bacterium]